MSLPDLDQLLQRLVEWHIQTARLKHRLGLNREQWRPGKRLKLLLVGYNGACNTGADVRVTEIIRQLRHIIGHEAVELTVVTFNQQRSAGYFPGTRQVPLPLPLLPKFLFQECARYHGVVASEGSMFKSKFTDVLSILMGGALGMANAEGKLSVGYGAEAGVMTASLRAFVQQYCRDSFIICRNEPSRAVLHELGIRTTIGTDTAWTFAPAPPERGAALLQAAGWDGSQQILAVCPINPFWWPVGPSVRKFIGRYLAGKYKDQHYYLTHFHHHSAETERKYQRYLDGLAEASRAFSRERPLFTIVVGMERLDRRACQHLSARLFPTPPCFISDAYNIYDLVSILRHCSFIVSSRFHAIVSSMPAQVPSIGVTMDERIRNLMHDRGHADLLLEVADPDLGEKLLSCLRRLERDREAISAEIGQAVPRHLCLMGQMGMAFMDELICVYPEFPRPNLPRSWEAYLPPLPPVVRGLVEGGG